MTESSEKTAVHIGFEKCAQLRCMWTQCIIKRALTLTNWDHLFLNKDVHQRVKILGDTLFNVFSNYTPKKVVTFDDKRSTMND